MDRRVVIGISSAGRYVVVSEKNGLIYFNKDNIKTNGIVGFLSEDGFLEIEESFQVEKILKMLRVIKLPVVAGCHVLDREDFNGARKYIIRKPEYDISYYRKKMAVVGLSGIEVSKLKVVSDRKVKICFEKCKVLVKSF